MTGPFQLGPGVQIGPSGEVTLRVHVQPGASGSSVEGWHGDALKLRVSAPPDRGKANEAVCRLLAAELDLRASDVTVVSGAASRRKSVRIERVDLDRLRSWIGLFDAGP